MKLRDRLLRDAGYNLIQTGVLQATGLVTFFITSRYLPKADYGSLNWALALSTTITTLCNLGLDQSLVHRIAQAGSEPRRLFGLHFLHTIISALLLMAGSTVWVFLSHSFRAEHPYFLVVFFSALALYSANSFRLALTGLGRFKAVAAISIAGNGVKMLGIPLLWMIGKLTVPWVAAVWLFSGMVEAVTALIAGARQPDLGVRPRRDRLLYRQMLAASAPLFIALVFDTALAKIDWILMGVMGTKNATADYIFAYKMFELAKLPLLVASPLFLPYLTRMLHEKEGSEAAEIPRFLKLLMFVAVLIPLAVAQCWVPVMEAVTDGKYGAGNYTSFLLLAICVPLHYTINFYYFKATALGQYRSILIITALVSTINFGLNLLLIPAMGGLGAALAFLIATIMQAALYLALVSSAKLPLSKHIFLLPVVFGGASFALGHALRTTMIVSLLCTLALYLLLSFAAGFMVVPKRLSLKRP